MKRFHFVIGLLCLAVPEVASAHSFGTRTMAPGASLVPRYQGADVGVTINDDRPYWRTDLSTPGWARVAGSPFATNYHYARMSFAHDSEFLDGTLAFTLRAEGGQANTSQMCYAVYSISSAGTISAFGGSACTTGVAISNQNLARSLAVVSDSAVVIDVAGQNGSTAKYLRVTYD